MLLTLTPRQESEPQLSHTAQLFLCIFSPVKPQPPAPNAVETSLSDQQPCGPQVLAAPQAGAGAARCCSNRKGSQIFSWRVENNEGWGQAMG